jgi:hypothetical protein
MRVIWHQPAFWLKTASTVAFGSALYLGKGADALIVAVLIGLAIVLAWFPLWRRGVHRHRDSWTFGNPQLLDEDLR